MFTQEQINDFIKEKAGSDELKPGDDLMYDQGVSGDDFDELITGYAETFHVDMTSYLWYFHTDEEGNNMGGVFFKPPNERVPHIPVTPAMLLDFANKGHWDVHYPPHKMPKRRWDIIFNFILFAVITAWAIYSWVK